MSIETLTEQILNKIPTIGKWQHKFIIHLFSLWLCIRGRYNYTNLARYGHYGEDTYRKNAGRSFPFLTFNRHLVTQHFGCRRIIAFDPTYISKSGKHTAGVGYFYSGCAGREKWGLEFGGIAAIDLDQRTALHLEAVQTIKSDKDQSLLQYYATQLIERKEALHKISTTIAVDAFFSLEPFITPMVEAGFTVVTRLRKNTYMRYLYQGPKRQGRGRPKQYDGPVNPWQLDFNHFTECARDENKEWIAYEAVVNIRSWKRIVKLVVVHTLDVDGAIKGYKLFASTNTKSTGSETKLMYNCRFQIEFPYRDCKQELGLEHCQARSSEKLHFHVNTALTCLSLAKVAFHFPNKTNNSNEKIPFSIADIKNANANEFLLDKLILWFGMNPKLKIIKSVRAKIRQLGKRAA